MQTIYDNIKSAPKNIQKLIEEFIAETKSELWDTEKELLDHYRKDLNYKKLKDGEVGGNLIYKYKSKSLVETGADWIIFFKDQVFKAVLEKQSNIKDNKIIKRFKSKNSFRSLDTNPKRGAVKALFDKEIIPFVHGLY